MRPAGRNLEQDQPQEDQDPKQRSIVRAKRRFLQKDENGQPIPQQARSNNENDDDKEQKGKF